MAEGALSEWYEWSYWVLDDLAEEAVSVVGANFTLWPHDGRIAQGSSKLSHNSMCLVQDPRLR